MSSFRNGSVPVLVATTFPGNLDVDDINYTINFDFPKYRIEEYVERVNHTCAKGTAFTFFTKEDAHLAKNLMDILNKTKQTIPSGLLQFVSDQGKDFIFFSRNLFSQKKHHLHRTFQLM